MSYKVVQCRAGGLRWALVCRITEVDRDSQLEASEVEKSTGSVNLVPCIHPRGREKILGDVSAKPQDPQRLQREHNTPSCPSRHILRTKIASCIPLSSANGYGGCGVPLAGPSVLQMASHGVPRPTASYPKAGREPYQKLQQPRQTRNTANLAAADGRGRVHGNGALDTSIPRYVEALVGYKGTGRRHCFQLISKRSSHELRMPLPCGTLQGTSYRTLQRHRYT